MKRKWFWLSIGLLIGLCVGFVLAEGLVHEYPQLTITGDLAEDIQLNELWQDFATEKVSYQGKSYQAVPLKNILAKANVSGKLNQVYFVAEDGFASVIKAEDAAGCYIYYHTKTGWSVLAPKHPISTNVKELQNIFLVADGEDNVVLSLTDAEGNTKAFSWGALMVGTSVNYPYFEGEAKLESEEQVYSSSIYTYRRGFDPSKLIDLKGTINLWLEDKAGSEYLTALGGYFLFDEHSLTYITGDGKIYENIIALTVPPSKTIKNK